MTGFIVFGHGSRVESANESVRAAAAVMGDSGGHVVEPAFLELGEPDVEGAAAKLISRGVSRIVVIPYFLTLGTHLRRDLPRIAEDASRQHNGIEITIAAPLEGHPALITALLDRAETALAGETR